MNIVVFQTDNRDCDFITFVKTANRRQAAFLGYKYVYEHMHKKYYESIHPAAAKLFVVHNFIHNNSVDIMIFLDTDAWIQNTYKLALLVDKLIKSDKNGCLSRDPYLACNTFVNSGSFILKINDYTKQMYKKIIGAMQNNPEYSNNWPFDQYYFSDFIYKNKERFYIFRPEVLNTPDGIILRHNWYKNELMLKDLKDLLQDTEELVDNTGFPNKD